MVNSAFEKEPIFEKEQLQQTYRTTERSSQESESKAAPARRAENGRAEHQIRSFDDQEEIIR